MFRHSMAAEDNWGGVRYLDMGLVVAYPDISRHSNLKRIALKLKFRLGWTLQNLSFYLKPIGGIKGIFGINLRIQFL